MTHDPQPYSCQEPAYTLISAYALTLAAAAETKEGFYTNLDQIFSAIPKEDKLIFLAILTQELNVSRGFGME